ncbi:MAG: hypothetical protein J6M64_08455 [Oscillospiraceae bacterium]|nr:hypothetical protein [Oscillospiraceae bacterium]
MAKYGGISGTPWHVERFTRAEGDERRHRSRCIHYIKERKTCIKVAGPCNGAAHCKYYKEVVKNNDSTQNGALKLNKDEVSSAASSQMPKPKGTGVSLRNIDDNITRQATAYSRIKPQYESTNENTIDKEPSEYMGYCPGREVIHKKYGEGKIQEINGNMAMILFYEYGIIRGIELGLSIKKGDLSLKK